MREGARADVERLGLHVHQSLRGYQAGSVSEGLVGSDGVVLHHPGVEGSLSYFDGGMSTFVIDEKLVPVGPVEALDLAGRCRRVRGGQSVLDPVVVADPVEEHRSRSRAESGREDLAIVREDLVRGAVLLQSEGEGVTDRLGRRPAHDAGADAVSTGIVDAGDYLHLGAVGQIEPADGTEVKVVTGVDDY